MLRERVQRIAGVGRLRMPTEHAVALIHAAGVRTVATLLVLPERGRDPQLSPVQREVVLPSISVDVPVTDGNGTATLAVALHALLGITKAVMPRERPLLDELLKRLSNPTSSD